MASRVYPNLNAYMQEHPEETLTALAREMGISKGSLCMIRYGQRQPALELALKMCKRFSIPLESLIRRHKKAS